MTETNAKRLATWLGTPVEQRDIQEGALLVRQIVHNQILADNLLRFPKRFMSHAEYQLNKFNTLAVAQVEHAAVEQMSAQVAAINKELQLDQPLPGNPKDGIQRRLAKTETFKAGKRADHNSLPEEIKALYVQNLSIVQQMRAIHAQLVVITNAAKTKDYCPDGDRYPLCKELIELDQQYRKNWEEYDKCVIEN